jgi:hypothetical protein
VQDISVFKALAKIDELKAVKSYKHVDKFVFFLKVINASEVNQINILLDLNKQKL